MYEAILLKLDFDHVVQLLTHLPETISSQELFNSIEQMKRSPLGAREKRKFAQILSEITTTLSPTSSSVCSPSPSMSNISVGSGK